MVLQCSMAFPCENQKEARKALVIPASVLVNDIGWVIHVLLKDGPSVRSDFLMVLQCPRSFPRENQKEA